MTETTKRPVRKTKAEIQNKKVKKWNTLWAKWILIWLLVFFILIIWIIFFFFFYITKNPQLGKWIWLSTSTIKSVTTIFAILFFWTFFIVFLVMGVISLYKLITKPSVWRTLGTFMILILWLTNLWFWWYVFSQIHRIKDEQWINTKEVLIANAMFSENNKLTPKFIPLYSNTFPLIWPQWVSFQLNKKIFLNNYLPAIRKEENGNIQWIKFILDCGNWQKIIYKWTEFSPYKYCLYLKKWTYQAKLSFFYRNTAWQVKTFYFPVKEININSNLIIKSKYKLNDEQNEIIGGEVWDTIKFDLTQIPLDLWLENNNLEIDFEWNGKFKTYKGIATHTYSQDKLYYVRFRIPNSTYPTYVMPIRILPSTKPTCKVEYKEDNGNYIITAYGHSPNGSITKYIYLVSNLSTNELISKGIKNNFKIKLKNWNNYMIKFYVQDIKKLRGSCSTTINLSDKVNYTFNLQIKSNTETIKTWANTITIKVKKLPTDYTITIKNISPETYNEYWFDIDQDGTIDENTKQLNISIKDKKDRTITAIVKDQYWNTTKKNINFKIDLKPVVAVLKTINNKGEAPLKVRLDASSSYVTKTEDSIAFFHWEFGDGTDPILNSRQGIITHIYNKPGKFLAKVTVETYKWYKSSATTKIIVFKATKSASIIFPDNMWWQIQTNEPLNIQLNTNWTIKHIHWDFGDGNIFDCDGRECTNITHTYQKTWIFTISATISYLDGSPNTTTTAKINVIWN